MPGRFLAQIVDQEDPYPLRYWRKAGIHVRAGTGPVDIVVPAAWRDRVAITFGEGDNAPGWVSTLRIAKCKPYGRKWLPYAGGFTFSEPACVPLIVRTGGRSQTLRFGIGRRC